jgi:hypothetical protein
VCIAMAATTRNILHFEPAPLAAGDLDITASLPRALAAVPKAHEFMPDRPEHGGTILFPSLWAGAAYVLREPVDVPGDRNVRLAADSPFGARIEFRPTVPPADATLPALRSRSGRRAHVFEDLIFRGGGVVIGNDDKPAIGMTEFHSCVFTDITHPDHLQWAISTGAKMVVGVRILNCTFIQTDHGVGVLHRACDNWIIGDNSRFVRMRGIGVEIGSSGVTVRDARFENKRAGAGDQPYIRVRGAPGFDGGLSEITACRFGGEVGLDFKTKPDVEQEELHGPPRHVIELCPTTETDTPVELVDGDDGSDEGPHKPVVGMRITGNRFLGRTRSRKEAEAQGKGGPTGDSAVHAIAQIAPVRHTVVAENHFRRY